MKPEPFVRPHGHAMLVEDIAPGVVFGIMSKAAKVTAKTKWYGEIWQWREKQNYVNGVWAGTGEFYWAMIGWNRAHSGWRGGFKATLWGWNKPGNYSNYLEAFFATEAEANEALKILTKGLVA